MEKEKKTFYTDIDDLRLRAREKRPRCVLGWGCAEIAKSVCNQLKMCRWTLDMVD